MKRKPKTLETKLRSALRLIWSRSAERRAILKAVQYPAGRTTHYYAFKCPICNVEYPLQMAEVDHEPPIGVLTFDQNTYLQDRDNLAFWTYKLFFGPQRAICKLCHKQKTALQRRKK